MSKVIDEEFLKRNLFEKAKIGCGYFPWSYYDKRYDVVIATETDGGSWYISVSNNVTKDAITFERKKNTLMKLTEDDLHRCIQFMNVPDEFDYTKE